MAKETITIGCKIPSGLILEVGYKVDPRDGAMTKGANYARIELKGWHQHTAAVRAQGIQVPAGMQMQPFLNRGVDKAVWEEWKRLHPDSWLFKNEILFEVKAGDEASAALRVAEGSKTPTVLAPLNKDAPIVPGIAEADFAKAKRTGTDE